MGLKFYLKKFFGRVYHFLERIKNVVHHWTIETHYNVLVDKPVIIASSAKIDIIMGGSIHIGRDTQILDGVLILTYGGHIKIGTNCNINPYTVIYGHGNTTIGNNVLIAGGCMIIPSNHNFHDVEEQIIKQGCTSKGIQIEDNVWIGHGCSILDNVTIGEGAIIAAGSVVNKSIPPFSIAAGVPAKIIRNRK